tara:strand:+ start:185 stop:967 length:783 start_codon:yes stop_codon:yes gene_type:complete
MYEELINVKNIDSAAVLQEPFPHCVIDDFFNEEIALLLEKDFPSFNNDIWHRYRNPLEVKNASNNWNHFPPLTYKVFQAFNSNIFCQFLKSKFNLDEELHQDSGLHGGGWHMLSRGGKLNPHLDYFIHPKLKLQRKINLIIYLNHHWKEAWGGDFGLWESDTASGKAGKLAKSISPLFNRAIIFETSNSWHGIAEKIECPSRQYRKSLAAYYLIDAPNTPEDSRYKALFAPTVEQEGDASIIDLINKRASLATAKEVWKI